MPIDNFKSELKELLKKYNADICFNCSDCSDTYGLFDDHIEIEIDGVVVYKSASWCLDL